MQFGLFAGNVGPYAEPDNAVELASAAEDCGFDSVWAIEHAVIPAGYSSRYPYSGDGKMPAAEVMNITDPLVWLAYVAAATRSIRLATGVVILPQRNPVIFAKEVATLDRLSGGRVSLGIGVGWLEEEFDALGVPFTDRGARTDDNVAAMRALWAGGEPSYAGRFTRFERAISLPGPVQQPVPVIVGGHSPAACRRAGRLGDGFYPGVVSLDDIAVATDRMRAAATEAGRDPDAIEITIGAPFSAVAFDVDEIRRAEDLGVSRVTILPLAFDRADIRARLDDYASDVIAKISG